jgi:hypothetical protein
MFDSLIRLNRLNIFILLYCMYNLFQNQKSTTC